MIQTSNALQEAMRAMGRINQVELMSRRVARGLPPVEPQAPPPKPPTPEETLGNVLHPHQVEAVARAIAAAAPDQQGQLISEAHDSLTRWIDAHHGKVVVDGKIHLAKNPQAAETLAAQILNREIEGRDRQAGKTQTQTPTTSATDAAQSAEPAPAPPASSEVAPAQDTARPALQPTADVDQLRAAAAEHAPTLAEHLENAVAGVPGARVEGIRDEKDPARLAEKIGDEGRTPDQVSDYLAGRVSVDTPEDKEQVVAALKGQAPVIQDEDHFHDGGKNQFHSHNLQVQVHPDISAEVQVLPREQADIAEGNHPTYEQQRSAAVNGDQETAEQLGQDLAAKNDQAMQEFNARQDHGERGRKALEAAGLKVGNPILLGGKLFFAVNPAVGQETPQGSVAAGAAGDGAVQPASAAGPAVPAGSEPLPDNVASAHAADSTSEVPNVQWDQDVSQAVPGSGEAAEAAAAEDSAVAPAAGGNQDQPTRRYAKGEAVTLADGRQGTVAYHHPQLDKVRVKVDGRNWTMSTKDLSAAS